MPRRTDVHGQHEHRPPTPLDTGCTERSACGAARGDRGCERRSTTTRSSFPCRVDGDRSRLGAAVVVGSRDPRLEPARGQVTVNGAGASEGASAFPPGMVPTARDRRSRDRPPRWSRHRGGPGEQWRQRKRHLRGRYGTAHGLTSANQIKAQSDGIGNRTGPRPFGIHLDTADTGNTVQGTRRLDASGGASGGSTGLSVDATPAPSSEATSPDES